ncbi:MAG TPA: prepilin-type N-terminal cleavage/methylation domain-containing protein [Thermoleophilia bacterium]|nr:prepilin-type N-terminal cleavage/methylation domain-containing protein [Thermoleophilia bacterium]
MDRVHRRREAGFSFVELLVTIIIAGIVFAAMVPVFLGTQSAVAGDQLRNSALQLAQDKLEKIRALDYDLIDQANLDSSTFMGGPFGTSVQWATGGGNQRTFTVAYQVDLLPEGSAEGTESHKQVTVTVTWTAPPTPKPVVLSTMVSKQYAGPQIVRFEIGPPNILVEDGSSYSIVSGPVVLDAYLLPDDILSMNQDASEENRGYVLFTVTSLNGTVVSSQQIDLPVSVGEPGHYQATWDNSTAADGAYIFQAVAVAGFGSRTQGAPVSIAMWYQSNQPSPPTNLSALSGDGVVYLTWVTPAIGDLSHYEVWRSTDGVSYAKLDDAPAESYTDTAVTNGTTYYYKVLTVDTESLSSAFTEAVPATPDVAGDSAPPSVPVPLTAVALSDQSTVHLTWGESIDTGNPAVGLAGYVIERSPNGSTDWTQIASLILALDYDDTNAGWSTTWYYRVNAIDLVGNASAWAGPAVATTGAQPLRTLTATNNSSNNQVRVWVQHATTLLWYGTSGASSPTLPGGVWLKRNNSITWNDLPAGVYNVYFSTSSSWSDVAITKAIDLSSGNATTAYP